MQNNSKQYKKSLIYAIKNRVFGLITKVKSTLVILRKSPVSPENIRACKIGIQNLVVYLVVACLLLGCHYTRKPKQPVIYDPNRAMDTLKNVARWREFLADVEYRKLKEELAADKDE